MATPPPENDPVAITARAVRRQGYMTLALFALLGLVGAYAFTAAQASRDRIARDERATARAAAATARAEARLLAAQCELRGELEQRVARDQVTVDRSVEFLRTHPDGIPGISAKLIAKGIADQQKGLAETRRVVATLSKLRCPEPKKQPKKPKRSR